MGFSAAGTEHWGVFCLGLPSNSAGGHPEQSGLWTLALKACPHPPLPFQEMQPCLRSERNHFGKKCWLGKDTGVFRKGRDWKPEWWSSGGLTGHQLSPPPYHPGKGTKEPAFVLGTLQGSRRRLLPSWEALCLACLIARPRVQPCRAGLPRCWTESPGTPDAHLEVLLQIFKRPAGSGQGHFLGESVLAASDPSSWLCNTSVPWYPPILNVNPQ